MENQPTMDSEWITTTIPNHKYHPDFVCDTKKLSSWRPSVQVSQSTNIVTNTDTIYKKNESQKQVPLTISRRKSTTNTSVLTPSNSTANTSCTTGTRLTFRLPDDPDFSHPLDAAAAAAAAAVALDRCIDMDAVPPNGKKHDKLQDGDEEEENDHWKAYRNGWNHHRALCIAVIVLLILVVILGTVVGVIIGANHDNQVSNENSSSSVKTNTTLGGHDDDDPLSSSSSSQLPFSNNDNNPSFLETIVPTIFMTTETANDPAVKLEDSVAPGPHGGRNI
jgi:hypothetical protein